MQLPNLLFHVAAPVVSGGADIAFLVDSSGSVGLQNFRNFVLQFMEYVVNSLNIGRNDNQVKPAFFLRGWSLITGSGGGGGYKLKENLCHPPFPSAWLELFPPPPFDDATT